MCGAGTLSGPGVVALALGRLDESIDRAFGHLECPLDPLDDAVSLFRNSPCAIHYRFDGVFLVAF